MSLRTLSCLKPCLVRRILTYNYLRNFSSSWTCIHNVDKNTLLTTNFIKMETRSMQRRKIAEKTLSQSTLVAAHDEKKNEFYVELPYAEGKTKAVPRAILQYEWIRDKYVDLYHTGVPEEFRGKGVAKILAEAALDHFVRDDVTMRLSCTYLQYHVEKYPIPRIMEKVDKTW